MNQDVPKNSGMFRVPGFIDARIFVVPGPPSECNLWQHVE